MTIQRVDRGSPAAKAGLKRGDVLTHINGKKTVDILDFIFVEHDDEFTVKTAGAISNNTGSKAITLTNPCGLHFDYEIKPRLCRNNCVFCFVEQNPPGMRGTLYVKDDDYRHSFISGNYVTLTNVRDAELERIIQMRLSPMYVSVHAFDTQARLRLLRIDYEDNLYNKLERLSAAGIEIHAQIVLVPDYNDGRILVDTLEKLKRLKASSVAVVPVGITKHCKTDIKAVSSSDAEAAISTVQKYSFAYCSDEMYLRCGALPQAEADNPQLENGVGVIARFKQDFKWALDGIRVSKSKAAATLVTGRLFAPFLQEFMQIIAGKFPNMTLRVQPIVNNFYGEAVTVAGLVTGSDIIAQAKGENLIIPVQMLNGDAFLDGVTVQDVERALCCKVHAAHGAEGLIECLRLL